ncbi:AcrR family transcriptional regulator [Paenibacillus sp. DS2015]|uniref:TetR/AcrR family transcriptional regulator n=1 Tax=Paenibacillus sp. DS2015 TaxID=3373917 RepID=UPI003D19E02C
MKTKHSNREVILRVARDLFLSKGYMVTSMDEIVTESKVSKTNIYYYFKSKEELLSAIIERMIVQYDGMMKNIATQSEISVMERMNKLIELLTEQDVNCLGGCPFLTLYTQAPLDTGQMREQFSHFFQNQRSMIEQLLAEGIEKKEINAHLPVKSISALIISTIEGALFLRHASQDEDIVKQSVQALAILLK